MRILAVAFGRRQIRIDPALALVNIAADPLHAQTPHHEQHQNERDRQPEYLG